MSQAVFYNIPLFFLFYLAVSKLKTNKSQNISYLTAEHFGFTKYTLNKIDWTIRINGILCSKPGREKQFGTT